MARRPGRHVLPFRVPFFRIFYSTTYTILYFICILLLAITPVSMNWTAIQVSALQYIFMIDGVYVLTAIIAIFIYSSRLYTNRMVLAGVGKAYIPIEDGEVGKSVRKMIAKQLERSAIVAWESRPRDLYGEIYQAEQEGILPPESMSVTHNDYTVGRIVQVDPASPPWRIVQHPGWSSPSQRDNNKYPGVQFTTVLEELPNLVEAQAVALAPPDPAVTQPRNGQAVADPAVVDLLVRPETMGMRDYLTQLSYLGLINPPELGQKFLQLYEHARFCGRPTTEAEFAELMDTFSELLAGMIKLDPAIIDEIRAQTLQPMALPEKAGLETDGASLPSVRAGRATYRQTPSPMHNISPSSSGHSPVTAREAVSRNATPYLQYEMPSVESFGSVIHNLPTSEADEQHLGVAAISSSSLESASMVSLPSDAGSVLRHSPPPDEHGWPRRGGNTTTHS